MLGWLGPLGGLNRFVAPLVIRAVTDQTGIGAEALRPIDRIGALAAPVLVLAGTLDRYTPLAETSALFARAVQPKELWEVEGAGHEDLHAFAGARYEQRVGDFLACHLRAAARCATPLPALVSGEHR